MDAETALKSLTAVVAIVGLWFGLWQYRAAQSWKRLEFAASVLTRLNSDPDLRLATTFLDWRQRDIAIPDRFLSISGETKAFQHTHALMADAFDLRNRERLPETGALDLKLEKLTLENIVYVDVFDRFFEYFGQVNAFINMGLVKPSDVVLLKYWAERVYKLQVNGRPVFREYLQYYEFEGVLSFAGANVRSANHSARVPGDV